MRVNKSVYIVVVIMIFLGITAISCGAKKKVVKEEVHKEKVEEKITIKVDTTKTKVVDTKTNKETVIEEITTITESTKPDGTIDKKTEKHRKETIKDNSTIKEEGTDNGLINIDSNKKTDKTDKLNDIHKEREPFPITSLLISIGIVIGFTYIGYATYQRFKNRKKWN